MSEPRCRTKTVLVHLASGVGNIVLATPLLVSLSRHGYTLDLLVDGDYQGTAGLFDGWSALRNLYDGTAGEKVAQSCDIMRLWCQGRNRSGAHN